MELMIENLTRDFDSKRALTVPRLHVPSGTMLAVTGPNGAGKTTLLRLIAALDAPTGGSIAYNGSPTPPLRSMTLLFQTPYLLDTTVERNIACPLKLRAWDKTAIRRRVDELCAQLSLEPLRRRRAATLSGGEAQKTALARALSFAPDLLLLDEPTSNIDISATADIERMLKKANADGATVVIVTHDPEQVARLGCEEYRL